MSQLKNTISASLASIQRDAPRNPHLAAQMSAKISLLQDTELHERIVNRGYAVSDAAASVDGRQVYIVAVYSSAELRNEAWYVVQLTKKSLPILEDFMSVPYPANQINIWYGFTIGNSGGIGVLNMEDKTTYEARWKPPMMPYDPIVSHELSHSYIGHEGLTQFLEIYVYNMVASGSSTFEDWRYLRDYRAWQGTKTGYAALLDVYQLIGLSAMERAYRTIYQLKPPYGQPLSSENKQAFVNEAPADAKSQVNNIMANVTY